MIQVKRAILHILDLNSGVPVFSDGTCLRFSMRAWGQFMANIYSDVDGINYDYMFFYMDVEDEKLPESNLILVKPLETNELSIGLISHQDQQLLKETLSFGMPFMTTDKVLRKYYDYFTKEE